MQTIPITVISESPDHSGIAAYSCVKMIINHVTEKVKPQKVVKVIIWSDDDSIKIRIYKYLPTLTGMFPLNGITMRLTMERVLWKGLVARRKIWFFVMLNLGNAW